MLSGPKLTWVIRLSPIPSVLPCWEIAERVVGSGGKLKWCQDLCTDYELPYEKGPACQMESLSLEYESRIDLAEGCHIRVVMSSFSAPAVG